MILASFADVLNSGSSSEAISSLQNNLSSYFPSLVDGSYERFIDEYFAKMSNDEKKFGRKKPFSFSIRDLERPETLLLTDPGCGICKENP